MGERDAIRMKLFSALYNKMSELSKHQHAPYYLAAFSFIESSIFPIPPDVMMIPMALAKPAAAWRYAAITMVASVLGGLFGYFLGAYLFHLIFPVFQAMGYEHSFARVKVWFDQWGFWAVVIAGFSPIPYKLFTISAGAMAMPLIPFTIASIIGRSLRFYFVGGLIYCGGERFNLFLSRYIDWMGWAVVFILVVFLGLWQGGIIHG